MVASRRTSSSGKRRRSTGRRRSATPKRATKRPAKAFKITRPGALTAAKRPGETTKQAATRLKRSGTPLQRKQANFYLNVLRPANRKRKAKGKRKRG